MTEMDVINEDWSLVCHKCGAVLTRGDGSFYVVKNEAFADPSPPSVDTHDRDPEPGEMQRLIDELAGASEREMMDQVYRRLTLMLCGGCYGVWIDQPTG